MVTGVFCDGRNIRLKEGSATIKIDGIDYDLFNLKTGVNSSVFHGKAQQGIGEVAVKFSSCASTPPKYKSPEFKNKYNQRYKRFMREIEAMNLAKTNNINEYVVEILDSGSVKLPIVRSEDNVGWANFPFFAMEFADGTLEDYLENELELQQKILLFREILTCFNQLHDINIYHRDIKPANVFRFGRGWKIGDLGLIALREEDDSVIDNKNEKIGPIGRLSPEATNKHLGNFKITAYSIDGVIDGKSDMYQLGLLFWFICQGEIPTGNLLLDDFFHDDFPFLFEEVLFPMLQYSKDRRAMINLEQFNNTIEPFKKDLGL